MMPTRCYNAKILLLIVFSFFFLFLFSTDLSALRINCFFFCSKILQILLYSFSIMRLFTRVVEEKFTRVRQKKQTFSVRQKNRDFCDNFFNFLFKTGDKSDAWTLRHLILPHWRIDIYVGADIVALSRPNKSSQMIGPHINADGWRRTRTTRNLRPKTIPEIIPQVEVTSRKIRSTYLYWNN